MLRIILIVLVLLFLVFWAYTAYKSQPLFSSARSDLAPLPAIADTNKALTFARTDNRLLLVTGMQAGMIRAIDLSSLYGDAAHLDPIGLYHRIGHDSLARLRAPETTVEKESLQLPLDFGRAHLAAGTNYKEHAEEVSLDDPPFLFPKLAEPTAWNARVRYARRLDFEAELAFVPLGDIHSPDSLPAFGMILVNDFTDRWTLIRGLRFSEPMGTTGFAAAKGQESYLPAGAFLVIPRKAEFYKQLELRLFVNDRLRQRFRAEDMILGVEDIVRQAFQDREAVYRNGDSTTDLIPETGIRRGSMILTGTSGGVIFKPVNIWWQGPYLKAGDVVRSEASFMGYMENEVKRFGM